MQTTPVMHARKEKHATVELISKAEPGAYAERASSEANAR
jgi:hypothetical protein